MTNFLLPIFLQYVGKSILIVVLGFSIVIPIVEGQNLNRSAIMPANETVLKSNENDPLIFTSFVIKDFEARVWDGIVRAYWNIHQLDSTKNVTDQSERTLLIYRTFSANNFVMYRNITVRMKTRCSVKPNKETVANCSFYAPLTKNNCMNYKLVFGSHTAYVTTVSITLNSTKFELTGNDEQPVKLTWKVACSNNYINPVPISIKTSRTVSRLVSGLCNPIHKNCSTYLDKSHVSACIPHILKVNHQIPPLNITIYPREASTVMKSFSASSVSPELMNISLEYEEIDAQCANRLKLVEVLGSEHHRPTEIISLPCQTFSNIVTCTSVIPKEKIPACRLALPLKIRQVWGGHGEDYPTHWVNATLFFNKSFHPFNITNDYQSEGIANNVAVRFAVQNTSQTLAVLSWKDPQLCLILEISEWQIFIQEGSHPNMSHSVFKPTVLNSANISACSHEYSMVVKRCETYTVIIRTILEQGNEFYSVNHTFKVTCPISFTTGPYGALGILLVIAILLFAAFPRICKRGKLNNKPARGKSITYKHGKTLTSGRGRITGTTFKRTASPENVPTDLDRIPHLKKRPKNIHDICLFDVGQARREFYFLNKFAKAEATAPVLLNQLRERNYTNASFIPGFGGNEREYIATQGPTRNTAKDFWRMLWEQEVQLIVMVSSLSVNSKSAFETYWPEKDVPLIYEEIQVELQCETQYTFYVERSISVSIESLVGLKRVVRQFNFTAWPTVEKTNQFGDPQDFIQFVEIIRKETSQLLFSSPIAVHCSTGVDGTGTFIALDYLIQQALRTDVVDVAKTVHHLRRYNLSMVQLESHYVFLYVCIAHYGKDSRQRDNIQIRESDNQKDCW